jgi:GWxTD domain-containing protein
LTSSVANRLRRLQSPALLAAALLAAGIAGIAGLAGCASGGGRPLPGIEHNLADLTNPALGPDYSQWLVGPISYLATKDEVAAYLALKDDRAAQAFIDQFWARRNPHPQRPDNSLLETFEERAAEADRLYAEGGFQGRRTDRGTIYILYGKPATTDYEISPTPEAPPIEVWTYPLNAPVGLSGRQPSPRYRFSKHGDLTVFYIPGQNRSRRTLHPGL